MKSNFRVIERWRANGWLVMLFLGFCLLYTAVQNIGYFDASDSHFRFQMMRALVTTGSPNWLEPGNPEPQVCLNSVGPAIAALPFQAVGYLVHTAGLIDKPLEQVLVRSTLAGTIFYTALWMTCTALLCVMLGSSRTAGVTVALIGGLTTLIFPYSKSAQAENYVGLCLTLIVMLLLRYSRSPALWHLVAIGVIYGLLLTTKNELAAVFPVLLGAVVLATPRPAKLVHYLKPIVAFGAAIIPGVAIILISNYLRFGDPFNTGHLGDTHGKSLFTPFSHPFWRGLYLQTFSPGKGIFWYCPVLFASIPLLWLFLKRNSRVLLLPYIWWALMTAVYAKWYSPAGDTALASRFQVSYLAFGVMSFLAITRLRPMASAAFKIWAILCIFVSLGLQLLMSAVSFNIDFHKQIAGVPIEKMAMRMDQLYYTWEHSLIRGFFRTAEEGLLDMAFVRYRPLEHAVTIYPVFWVLLAGAAAAFAAAHCLARPRTKKGLVTFALYVPVTLFLLLAIFQIGYPTSSGLKLIITNGDQGHHETLVQDIQISDMNEGRELYKVHTPVTMRWAGHIRIRQDGNLTFTTDSNRSLQIKLGNNSKAVPPGISETSFTAAAKEGYMPIEIFAPEVHMYDWFKLNVRLPGKTAAEPIGKAKLKYRL